MSTIHRKIELAANTLIIVVCAALLFTFVQKYYPFNAPPASRKSAQAQARASSGPDLPKVGDKVSLAGFDWSKSNKNVLLVLQKGCHFCSESAGFYRNLIRQTKDKGVNIVAVLPQTKDEAEGYLRDLSISGIEVRQSLLDSLLVAGTPTIIVANDKGEITDVWLGKLPAEKESEVISKLQG